MSKEFIEKGLNKTSIQQAATQESQLSYILTSKLQDNRLDPDYIKAWAERKYQTSDYFLNWVKMIFKSENFLSFFKYLRYPLPSTKIIHDRIEPQLKRVFRAEDSDFKYDVNGKTFADFAESLDIKKFNENIFNQILYYHNSILIADVREVNDAFRYFVDIDNVVSIEMIGDEINRIAFGGCIKTEDGVIDGFVYIDSERYSFYNKDYTLIIDIPHDLGSTPAHFISKNKFDNNPIVRESIFTYVRGEVEEYNFLRTLQRMTEPNGAIPVVSKIEVDKEPEDKRGDEGEPSSDTIMGSQQAEIFSQNESVGTGDLQPGTIHEVPISAIQKEDGSLDMEAVKSYLNFYHLPVDILTYLNNRVKELEVSIVSTIVGDFVEGSEASKNEAQIEKSVSILENTLFSFAEQLNRIRKLSDTDMLGLEFGINNVNQVFIHYGTDFFLDTQSKLFDDLGKAPNSLERKNIIVRINKNKHKNNPDILSRQSLFYDLMPFVSDKDFEIARDTFIDPITLEYQNRFTYWIGLFEAQFGDIVQFFMNDDSDNATRLKTINDLIIEIIKTVTAQQNAAVTQT